MAKSRTSNSFYNFFTGVFGQLLTILLQFIVRTVFIHTLGKSYLGIGGLFSNILQMLSLTELGVGSAILFKLYDPLAKKDEKRVVVLLKFYKKVYQVIGFVIIFIGLCLIPFLKYIISDYDSLRILGINAVFIYILYLVRTAISYFFFAYKSAIVKADQKEYKLNVATYIVNIVSSITEIIVLYAFKNFEIYVGVLVGFVIVQNYINARIAKKMYPYIDDKYDEKISKDEMKDIFKDCGALFLYKINNVVLKGTDNIIISIFLGLDYVGMYSNYYIFYNTINTIFGKVFESIKHSLGNLHTTSDKKHEYSIFKTSNLIAMILGATAGIGIACVSNEFVKSWIGEEWVLIQPFSILMGIEIFGLAFRHVLAKYRSAMGLFQQAKFRPVLGIIVNLVVSILFVKKLGISGVLLGTIIADWITIVYDPYIIHKFGLNNEFPVKEYYLKSLYNISLTVLLGVVCFIITQNLFINLKWISVIIHSAIIAIIVPSVFMLCYFKSEEMDNIKQILKRFTGKIKK